MVNVKGHRSMRKLYEEERRRLSKKQLKRLDSDIAEFSHIRFLRYSTKPLNNTNTALKTSGVGLTDNEKDRAEKESEEINTESSTEISSDIDAKSSAEEFKEIVPESTIDVHSEGITLGSKQSLVNYIRYVKHSSSPISLLPIKTAPLDEMITSRINDSGFCNGLAVDEKDSSDTECSSDD